jgi:hypothetical protein
MQTPEYARNAHKAAQAERAKDYPMAVVFWQKAAQSECTDKQRHWAECRCQHCNRFVGEWDV